MIQINDNLNSTSVSNDHNNDNVFDYLNSISVSNDRNNDYVC